MKDLTGLQRIFVLGKMLSGRAFNLPLKFARTEIDCSSLKMDGGSMLAQQWQDKASSRV
jgi:hypothetical protein